MSLDTTSRKFRPGTTGWTAGDLDDPAIEATWERGRYEIVEGVLTKLPPAILDSAITLGRFIHAVQASNCAHPPPRTMCASVPGRVIRGPC